MQGKVKYNIPENSKQVSYRLGPHKTRRLTYQKANMLKSSFKPVVLDRYPKEDRKDYPFNNLMAHFCFPSGITLHMEH